MKYILASILFLAVGQAQAEKLNFNEMILDVEVARESVHDSLIKEEPNHRLDQVREKKIQKIETHEEWKQKGKDDKEMEDLFSYQQDYQKKSIKKQSLKAVGHEVDESLNY